MGTPITSFACTMKLYLISFLFSLCNGGLLVKRQDEGAREDCSAAPQPFQDQLLAGADGDCEGLAATCKDEANAIGVSQTNCEACKRICLNPGNQGVNIQAEEEEEAEETGAAEGNEDLDPNAREDCDSAPQPFRDQLLAGADGDCEGLAATCKDEANAIGVSQTNCEACKRICLNPGNQGVDIQAEEEEEEEETGA